MSCSGCGSTDPRVHYAHCGRVGGLRERLAAQTARAQAAEAKLADCERQLAEARKSLCTLAFAESAGAVAAAVATVVGLDARGVQEVRAAGVMAVLDGSADMTDDDYGQWLGKVTG